MKSSFLSSKGLTLVEILVTIAVFAIIIPLVGSYYDPRPKQREEMRSEMVEILTLLESARGYAISNVTVQDPTLGEIVPISYGIHIDLTTKDFIFFANTTEDGTFDAADFLLGQFQATRYSDMTFSGELTANDGNPDGATNTITILFYPPDGRAQILDANGDPCKELILTVERPGLLKETITFNRISGFFERKQVSL